MYCALVGIAFGIGYYNIIKPYYPLDKEKNKNTNTDSEKDEEPDTSDFFDY